MSRVGFGILSAAGALALLACGACSGGSSQGGAGGKGSSSSSSGHAGGPGTTSSSSTSRSSSSASGASSSSSAATSSSSNSSSSSAKIGSCARPCSTVDDCCGGDPNCPGAYPANVTCAEGTCHPPQCATKADCATVMAPSTNYDCLSTGGAFQCQNVCALETDCAASEACTGVASNNVKYCVSRCKKDLDCGANATCSNGDCLCANDAYCNGYGKCELATGQCICASDSDCTAPKNTHCAL